MYKYTYSTVVRVNLIKKLINKIKASFVKHIMRPLTWCGKLDVALESKSLPTPVLETHGYESAAHNSCSIYSIFTILTLSPPAFLTFSILFIIYLINQEGPLRYNISSTRES